MLRMFAGVALAALTILAGPVARAGLADAGR